MRNEENKILYCWDVLLILGYTVYKSIFNPTYLVYCFLDLFFN